MKILRSFYHPDHLGSTSWITDRNGDAIQYLHYLPFGEEWIDQRSTSWNAQYSFTGKIKDAETGYNYFGARYYDSGLSVWLSVDPLSDKYPTLSPYTYCANNPIMMVDPDGRWILGINNKPIDYTRNSDGSITWTKNTTDDVKLLGNIMLQTKIGTFWFDAMKNAKHNITIKIDNSEQENKSIYGSNSNFYGDEFLSFKTDPKKIKSSKITIFAHSLQNAIDTESRYKGTALGVMMAYTLVHEAVHATCYDNMRASILYHLFESADLYNCFYNNKEADPNYQASNFLKEYSNLK